MSSIYRKYRPQKFSELSGQIHIIKTLSNEVKTDRLAHAYLFTGPRGTGKTTLARIFTKAINCLDPQAGNEASSAASMEPCNQCKNCKLIMENRAMDFIEIDAASNTGVDNIRQLKETIVLPPTALKYKIYIIDEVHMLSIGAFNALLKTLEEPPAHAIFILATTELHKVPETIISRCQRFDFGRLTHKQIIERLENIAKEEDVEIELDALETIALEAEGGMRDAESLFGQIISIEDKKITAEEVSQILGTCPRSAAFSFTELVIDRKHKEALEEIDKLEESGISLRNFNKLIISYLRNILIIKASPNAAKTLIQNLSPEQMSGATKLSEKLSFAEITNLIDRFQKSFNDIKESPIPQLPLELAVLANIQEQPPIVQTTTPAKAQPQSYQTQQTPKKEAPKSDPKKDLMSYLSHNPGSASVQEESAQEPSPEKSSEEPESYADNTEINFKLEDVLNAWNQITEEVKPFNHSIYAIFKNCVPIGIDDGKIYIRAKHDFNKQKLNEINNRLTVQKVIAKIFKCRLQVAFVNEKEASAMNFEATAPNEDRNILHDAMQIIGGRIVEQE